MKHLQTFAKQISVVSILTADIHGLICKTNAITLQPVSRRFCQLGHIPFLAEALAAIITLTSLNISPKQP